MTRNQWLIVAALAVGVVFEFCLIGAVLFTRYLPAMLTGEVAAAIETATELPASTVATPIETVPSTPTPLPTSLPAPSPTATWVIQPNAPGAGATRVNRPRVPGPIQDAWDKSTQAKSMRFQIEMTMKGDLGQIPGAQPGQEISMMDMSGETSGKDTHLIMKGFIVMFLTGDVSKSVEMMTVGDKSYVHGPMPMFGAPEDKWYVGSAGSGFNLGSSQDPVDAFKGQNQDWSSFNKTGSEKLDGRTCDVYTADKDAAMDLFNELSKEQNQMPQELAQMINAQVKVWICDDGYFHQLLMNMDGEDKNKPGQKMSILMRIHFSDLDGDIKISPPANPVPLKTPAFFNFGTPTPKPSGGMLVPVRPTTSFFSFTPYPMPTFQVPTF